MNYESRLEKKEINLKDFFWGIVSRWKWMILWGCILAILGGIYSYVKSVKIAEIVNESVAEDTSMELEDIELYGVEQYLDYKSIYEDKIRYNQNTPLLKLDSNCFYRASISLFIDDNYSVSYPEIGKTDNAEGIKQAYLNLLNGEKYYSAMEKIIPEDVSLEYAEDYLFIPNSSGADIESASNAFIIEVICDDEKLGDEILNIVIKLLEGGEKEIEASFGEHTLVINVEKHGMVADNNILKYQQDNLATAISYRNNLLSLKEKMSDDQLIYINEIEAEEKENRQIARTYVSKKMCVLGFIIGVFLCALCLVLKYWFNKYIRLEDDLERLYGVEVLAKVAPASKKKGIDGWIRKKRWEDLCIINNDDCYDLIITQLSSYRERKQLDNVFMIADLSHEKNDSAEKLKNIIENKTEFTVEISGDPSYNAVSIQKMQKVSGVILLVVAGETTYLQVQNAIKAAKKQNMQYVAIIAVAR